MDYIPLIIVLVLILTVIISIYTVYRKIVRKVRSFTKEVYGTTSLRETKAKMKAEYETTPKSVSAMTSLCLPKITRDFPDFSYNEMKARERNLLVSYLNAITLNEPSVLTEGTQELKDKLNNRLAMLNARGQSEHFDNVKLHRTEISQYRKSAGRCIVTFQSSVEYRHYLTDGSSKVISGDKLAKFQSRYNVDLIYIQDRSLVESTTDETIGLKCPNCDAPYSSLNAKKCAYCGTPIIEFNIKAWDFNDITEL